jgi:hypothetical protein
MLVKGERLETNPWPRAEKQQSKNKLPQKLVLRWMKGSVITS